MVYIHQKTTDSKINSRFLTKVSRLAITTQVIKLLAFYPAKRDFTSLFPLSGIGGSDMFFGFFSYGRFWEI